MVLPAGSDRRERRVQASEGEEHVSCPGCCWLLPALLPVECRAGVVRQTQGLYHFSSVPESPAVPLRPLLPCPWWLAVAELLHEMRAGGSLRVSAPADRVAWPSGAVWPRLRSLRSVRLQHTGRRGSESCARWTRLLLGLSRPLREPGLVL